MCVCVCVRARARASVVCMCVGERESVRACLRVCERTRESFKFCCCCFLSCNLTELSL